MTPNYLYDHSANLILYWERQGTFWRHLDISYRFLCIWHVCKMSVGVVMVITEKERLYSGMMLCFVWDLNQYFVEVELKSFKYKDHLSSLCHDKLSCIPHTCKYSTTTILNNLCGVWSEIKLSTLWLGPHIVLRYSSGLYVDIVFKDEAKLKWFFIWLLFWQDSMYQCTIFWRYYYIRMKYVCSQKTFNILRFECQKKECHNKNK